MDLRLRPFKVSDELAGRAAQAELFADDFTFMLDWNAEDPWPDYLRSLERLRRGIEVPPDRVPGTFLAAVVDGVIVGRVSIRHELNDYLKNFGGHIGYAVRPQHRRRGFATEILRQALIVARAEGVEEVLVTCDIDNLASATIIERLGGAMEDIRDDPEGPPKRRYWID